MDIQKVRRGEREERERKEERDGERAPHFSSWSFGCEDDVAC